MAGDNWICSHSTESRKIILSAVYGVQLDDYTYVLSTVRTLHDTLRLVCVRIIHDRRLKLKTEGSWYGGRVPSTSVTYET